LRSRDGRLKGLVVAAAAIVAASACEPTDPDLAPDEVLQAELGLSERDRVHRVTLTGGEGERAEPAAISIRPGAHVEFVTADWLIHEVIFSFDEVGAAGWEFLERTDQTASPPLIERESRYLLSFEGAPLGRYPYRLEGNGPPGRGVIVVQEPGPP
jgi:plastocyanin